MLLVEKLCLLGVRKIRIAVFGAGSLGSVLGAILSKKNDILLITRGEHLNAIRENGLRVEGFTNGLFNIPAEEHYPGGYDIIILTVKAYQTKDAIREIRGEYKDEIVITFQNGVGIVDMLGDFDVIPGVTTHGATLISPGIVRHAGYGDTFIGEKNGELTERIFEIAKNFTESGLKTEVVNDIMERRWIKAAVNAVINSLTAIFSVKNGEILENENLKEMARCISQELSSYLQRKGIKEDIYSIVEDVSLKTKENESSMLQDIKRGRKTEVDYILKPFYSEKCFYLLYHMIKYMEK